MKIIERVKVMTKPTALHGLMFLSALLSCVAVFSTPVSAQTRDEVVYFHNDALGSAVAAVNESGDLCWRQDYTPYGSQTGTADRSPPSGCGLLGNERGYTGHTQDSSGLVYMQQRYYDPSLGRFLSVDPSGVNPDDPRTFNRYMYAANNPYKYTDPDGRIVFLALVPIALKAIDIAITAAEVTAAAQTGGATAVAGVVAESVMTSVVPGGKLASKVGSKIGKSLRSSGGSGSGRVTREDRWMELANEPNSRLPKEMIDFINRHDGKGVTGRFGQELAHRPKKPSAQGHDYGETLPKWRADHRGIQHRYLKERSTGTTISMPKNKRGTGKLSLPPKGALP